MNVMSRPSSEQSDSEYCPQAGDSESNTSPMLPVKESQQPEDRRPFFRNHSAHSSRSTSFNDSAAKVILGLFQESIFVDAGCSDYAHEDPAVRAEFIRRDAQNPDSWIHKKLTRPEHWNDDHNKVRAVFVISIIF